MNYNNANSPRPGAPGRKMKRVSDVASLGMAPSPPPYPAQYSSPSNENYNQPVYNENGFESHNFNTNTSGTDYGQYQMNSGTNPQMPLVSSFIQNKAQISTMLQQPVVQEMAVEFGQQLANQGKDIVNKKIEKYVSVSELKYYFAVDTRYVIKKLFLILFPFTHKDWTIKYDQEHMVQPRFEINAPDLYIPIMAYVTYVVLAGVVLGMQQKFSPEQIGIQASSALAYNIFEVFIYAMIKYVMNIQTKLGLFDFLSYSGYKYVMIILCILISLIFKSFGYYACLIYCSVALVFFLMRTLKVKVLADQFLQNEYSTDAYNQSRHTSGAKRKVYFIFLISFIQPILSWWLSHHLIPA